MGNDPFVSWKNGKQIPVTVFRHRTNFKVVAQRTIERDGYTAVHARRRLQPRLNGTSQSHARFTFAEQRFEPKRKVAENFRIDPEAMLNVGEKFKIAESLLSWFKLLTLQALPIW